VKFIAKNLLKNKGNRSSMGENEAGLFEEIKWFGKS